MNIRSLTLASQHTDTRILLAKAEGVRATLERRNITNVAIVCREMGAFAPAFLGAARQGATIHLLPNTQEGTVIHVAKGGLVILHDDREHAGDAARGIYLPDVAPADSPNSDVDRSEDAHLVMWTSGTTGRPDTSTKSIAQLVLETEALATLFPGTTSVLTTVPPFHLFGLLFGLLLPLKLGARIATGPGFFLHDIGRALADKAVDLLVSTPAHLSSMLHTEMPKRISVASSGAYLPASLHFALMQTHEWHVTDVLGSTETGGMASRSTPLSRWTPLPGVTFERDASMRASRVRSPWCDEGTREVRDDLEFANDGTFTHRGRTDDIVKVLGKRASLRALEDLVRGLPGVRDVAIFQDPHQPGEARLKYAVAGTNVSKQNLAEAIGREFDPAFTPRSFVLLDALPREPTGKLPREKLAALFAPKPRERVAHIEVRALADGLFEAMIPRNLVFFEGHFRGLPILPGTVLLERVIVPAALAYRPHIGRLAGLTRIRFMRTLGPAQRVEVSVTETVKGRIQFEARSAGGVVATGVLLFAAA